MGMRYVRLKNHFHGISSSIRINIIVALCAGNNSHGQLGVPGQPYVCSPVQIPNYRWKAISLGGSHSAGVGDRVGISTAGT